jgi:hypothetical protein
MKKILLILMVITISSCASQKKTAQPKMAPMQRVAVPYYG